MTVPGAPQLGTHVPLPLQLAVAPVVVVVHALPQAPQLRLSLPRFTHAAPQTVSPGVVQLTAHLPALHVGVPPATLVVQTWPQTPQLFGSFARLTHALPHCVVPAALHAQSPPTHVAVDGHAMPHPPQLLWSVPQ